MATRELQRRSPHAPKDFVLRPPPTPPAPRRTTRVVLIDDHPFVRDGLAGLLAAQGGYDLVAEAGTAAEGVSALERLKPDLIVVDLRLPDSDGTTVLEAAKRLRWTTYTVVLSAFKSDDDMLAAARLGARAYLLKSARGPEVLRTLEAVLAGENVLEQEMSGALRQRFTQKDLTPRETEILRLVGGGLTNVQICRRKKITANTVKAHLRNIFVKLDVSNRSQATAIALRRGLIEG